MWLVFSFASAFFAGASTLLAKMGVQAMDSNLATAIRTLVVLVFAWFMVFLTGSFSTIHSIDIGSFVFLIASGLTTGASWLCYFRALRTGAINKVVPIDKASTILTMLLAFLFLNEPVSAATAVAMVFIGGGTWLMIEKKREEPPADKADEKNGWFLYAVLSAVFAALTAILGKIGIEGVESNLGAAIRTVVVTVMAWLIVFSRKSAIHIASIDTRGWRHLIASGIATGASWLCFYRALQSGPVSIVVPVDKLSILFSVLFGMVVLHEKISRISAIGLACIAIGTLLLVA